MQMTNSKAIQLHQQTPKCKRESNWGFENPGRLFSSQTRTLPSSRECSWNDAPSPSNSRICFLLLFSLYRSPNFFGI